MDNLRGHPRPGDARVLRWRGRGAGESGDGTAIKRSVSDGGRWTSNGCSPPLRRNARRFPCLETLFNANRAKLGAYFFQGSRATCSKAFLVPDNCVVCVYIYISLRWVLNDTVRRTERLGLNSSLKVSLAISIVEGCVFVRLITEKYVECRTKCVAIAKLSRNYSPAVGIIPQ